MKRETNKTTKVDEKQVPLMQRLFFVSLNCCSTSLSGIFFPLLQQNGLREERTKMRNVGRDQKKIVEANLFALRTPRGEKQELAALHSRHEREKEKK